MIAAIIAIAAVTASGTKDGLINIRINAKLGIHRYSSPQKDLVTRDMVETCSLESLLAEHRGSEVQRSERSRLPVRSRIEERTDWVT